MLSRDENDILTRYKPVSKSVPYIESSPMFHHNYATVSQEPPTIKEDLQTRILRQIAKPGIELNPKAKAEPSPV